MKVSLAITLEGLVRALRSRAHALADEAEDRYRRQPSADGRRGRKPDPPAAPKRRRSR